MRLRFTTYPSGQSPYHAHRLDPSAPYPLPLLFSLPLPLFLPLPLTTTSCPQEMVERSVLVCLLARTRDCCSQRRDVDPSAIEIRG